MVIKTRVLTYISFSEGFDNKNQSMYDLFSALLAQLSFVACHF